MSLFKFFNFSIISIVLNFLFVKVFNSCVLKKMKVENTSTKVITKNAYCTALLLSLVILFGLYKNIENGTYIFVLILIFFVMDWSKKNYYDNLDEYKNKNCFINLLNIDYVSSKFSKKLIKDENIINKYKNYINYKNKYNLRISFILFIFISVGLGIGKYIYSLYDTEVIYTFDFLCVFLFIRFISRAFEIIIAFYNDILDNKKKSNLKSGDRFKLAVNSLIEIVLRSATIYLLIDTLNYECGQSLISDMISSIYLSIINSINFASAYSIETNAIGTYEFIRKTVTVLQGLTSFVLIILSFAQYLSSRDDQTRRRKYRNYRMRNNK